MHTPVFFGDLLEPFLFEFIAAPAVVTAIVAPVVTAIITAIIYRDRCRGYYPLLNF